MPKLPSIVVGGTFDHIHVGHRRLIEAAFDQAQEVGIGLSSDALVKKSSGKGRDVASYSKRRKELEAFLKVEYGKRRWEVVELKTPEGRILEPRVGALAVSEETFPVGLKANDWRTKRGIPPLALVVACRVYADDLMPVASRRIRSGAIDGEGRRLTKVGLLLEGEDTLENSVPILGAMQAMMPGSKLKTVTRDPDYTVSATSGTKGFGISLSDSGGERLEARLAPEAGELVPPWGEQGDIRNAVFAHLISEAFLPRRLARDGMLPRSIVLQGLSAAWRGTGEWTRKVYSPSGIFPFE